MMNTSQQNIISAMEKTGMIPVFNHQDLDTCKHVVDAAYAGGVKVFEFTNRQENAINVFEHLQRHNEQYTDLSMGIGTIWNPDQAKAFIEAGTDFIVSPMLHKATGDYCIEKDMLWIPGTGTLTEIMTAHFQGAKVIKAFPGSVLGPDFISSALSVAPHLKLMPTGGVKPTEESLNQWFKAGVICVGMGSQLFDKMLISEKKWNALSSNIANALQLVVKIRG